jgi:hypothetical protein
MPRVTQESVERQHSAIESLLRTAPDGLDASSIVGLVSSTLGRDVQRRVLNRWLEALVRTGRIRRKGSGRATRYFPGVLETAPASAEGSEDDSGVPLTETGRNLVALLRAESSARPAIGYREHVIRDHAPGRMWHLPEAMRTKLRELGRTPDAASPPGTFARRHFDRFMLDLTCGSIALELEQPDYSRLEVQQLLEGGTPAQGKNATETQLILNHKRAIELLVDNEPPLGLDGRSLCNLHAALSDNLLADPANEGRLRTGGVVIPGSTLVPLADAESLAAMFELLLERVAAIPDPFEQSFFLLLQLPYLHPFAGVNDAVARIAANIPLVRANLCPLSFIGVSRDLYLDGMRAYVGYQKSQLLREVFAWAYERSCAQFRAAEPRVVAPDPIRLRYRAQLHAVVREVVVERAVVDEAALRAWGERSGVAAEDVQPFAEVAALLLKSLHEGGIGRYGISRQEYERWRRARDA